MAQNPQEEYSSELDKQFALAKKVLGTHVGAEGNVRPSQNPQPDWGQIDEAVNGKLKR
jgi:hypothetical protein